MFKLLSDLDSSNVTKLVIAKFGDKVTEFLPNKFFSKESIGNGMTVTYLTEGWEIEIKNWVDDVLMEVEVLDCEVESDEGEEFLQTIAEEVSGRLFSAYHDQYAEASNLYKSLSEIHG